MGKPTGFLEYARQERPCVPSAERLGGFEEFGAVFGVHVRVDIAEQGGGEALVDFAVVVFEEVGGSRLQ